MKIDGQIAPLASNFTSVESDKTSGFDRLLDSPTHQGDDYYWQHQHQLQVSALTFHPLVDSKAKKNLITSNYQDINQSITTPKAIPNADTRQLLVPINKPLEQSSSESIRLSVPEVESVIATLEHILQNPGVDPSARRMDPFVTNNSHGPQPINHPASLPNSMFKNYQLFLTNNVVELTLNTTQLSKQQASDLEKIIKQWLTHKGYSLKQLTINGVQR